MKEAITYETSNSVCNEKDFQVNLINQLNIENALGTVLNIKEAYDWFPYPSPDSQTLEWKARMVSISQCSNFLIITSSLSFN
jgi:hypothetical protein